MKPRTGPHPVDAHVGRAVRVRRRLRGLSQQALGERIGLTFQQIQKYESGANRISASALHAIAGALEVPVASFFEGLPGAGDAAGAETALTARMLGAPGGLALAEAWLDLPPGPLRHRLAALVQTTAAALRAPGAAGL
jgi:transcriptional regulator with XRE-family HTH domain